jgi:hypothetical protein
VYVLKVSLAGQWKALGSELPDAWSQVQIRLELRDAATASRAAALLGPAQPFRAEPGVLRFASARNGTAPGPDGITRLLIRLDDARIGGQLSVAGTQTASARAEREVTSLAESWDGELARLPPDWSDLYGEIALLSTDYVERAAVLCIQMNPRREGESASLRFRAARRAGYGVSPGMARRCLERCDEEAIRGSVHVLRVLSDTHLVATQGPVWQLDGKTI